MHTEYTWLFFVCLESFKLQTGTKYIENGPLFVRMLEILKALTNSSRCIQLSNKYFASVFRNLLSVSALSFRFEVFSLKTQLHKCLLTVLKCPLSVLERYPSYREFNYIKMSEKRPEPTQVVRLKEVSVL